MIALTTLRPSSPSGSPAGSKKDATAAATAAKTTEPANMAPIGIGQRPRSAALRLISPLLGRRFRHARFDQAHMPAIRVVLIDRDDGAMDLLHLAVRTRHGNRELGDAIAAIALNMDFEDFDRMAMGAGGEAFGIVRRERLAPAHERAGGRDQNAIGGVERGHGGRV